MKNAIIHLRHVTVRKDGVRILQGIDWTTHQGEHWFVMGRNGCGKTTLMELLAGYVWPTRGDVAVLGDAFGRVNLQELRTRVGFVSPWIFRRMPAHTSFEEVVASGFDGSAGAPVKRTTLVRRALARQLRFFGCTRLATQAFGTLSSGQQLKAVLARALVHDPSVLILDEPFSLLDVGARLEMYALLVKLVSRRDAPQVLLVTHHREDILPFFSHGLLMAKGQIALSGSRAEVLSPKALARTFGLTREKARHLW